MGKVASLSSYIHWIKNATNPLDPLTTSEPAATNPISSRYGPEAFIQTALELLRPLPLKRGGPHGPERAQACRDLLSASFSLPREKLALLFDGQLKTRQAPGTSSLGLPHPRPRRPKRLVQTHDTLRTLGSFPSPKAFNTTTSPQLPKYVSAAFGSLDLSWKLGPPRSGYGATVATARNPKARPTISFSPKSSATHKRFLHSKALSHPC